VCSCSPWASTQVSLMRKVNNLQESLSHLLFRTN
jgi:hypothetical protein